MGGMGMMPGGGGGGGFGGGGLGGGGGPDAGAGGLGAGGFGSNKKKEKTANLSEESVDVLAELGLGSKSARIAIGERLLRVELHLDIIRSLIRHADGREAVEEGEAGGFDTGGF